VRLLDAEIYMRVFSIFLPRVTAWRVDCLKQFPLSLPPTGIGFFKYFPSLPVHCRKDGVDGPRDFPLDQIKLSYRSLLSI